MCCCMYVSNPCSQEAEAGGSLVYNLVRSGRKSKVKQTNKQKTEEKWMLLKNSLLQRSRKGKLIKNINF